MTGKTIGRSFISRNIIGSHMQSVDLVDSSIFLTSIGKSFSVPFTVASTHWAIEIFPSGLSCDPFCVVMLVCLSPLPMFTEYTLNFSSGNPTRQIECSSAGIVEFTSQRGLGLPKLRFNPDLLHEKASALTLTVSLTVFSSELVVKPLYEKFPSPILEMYRCKFLTMFNDETNSDLTVVVGGVTIATHKCILTSFSPVFSMLLRNGGEDLFCDTLAISDFSHACVSTGIEFLYTTEIPPDSSVELIIQVIEFSNRFEITILLHCCEYFLIPSITQGNVSELLIVSFQNECGLLFEACCRVILSDFEGFLKSTGFQNLVHHHSRMMVLVLAEAAFVSTSSNDTTQPSISQLHSRLREEGMDTRGLRDVLVSRLQKLHK